MSRTRFQVIHVAGSFLEADRTRVKLLLNQLVRHPRRVLVVIETLVHMQYLMIWGEEGDVCVTDGTIHASS